MTKFIRHITLTSGHVRDSLPDEVPENIRAVLRPVIQAIIKDEIAETIAVPGFPGYSLGGRAGGKCLTVTLWRDGPPSELLISIGIAGHSRCGATLWTALHTWGSLPVVTDPERCPPEPWVAAAIEAPALNDPAMHWAGDLERCLAWTWIGDL